MSPCPVASQSTSQKTQVTSQVPAVAALRSGIFSGREVMSVRIKNLQIARLKNHASAEKITAQTTVAPSSSSKANSAVTGAVSPETGHQAANTGVWDATCALCQKRVRLFAPKAGQH